jgi:tRNA A-37 threonylcarbamoyl transferase component Bud32
MADMTGKTLGNYRLVERIGRGGMATVYKAYQPALERYVAVKVMHEQLAAEDAQFLKRFQREAKAIATLRHPNIVQVFDFGVEDDISYMVMEYLEGANLKDELQALAERGETMPLGEVQRIFRAIAGAVEHAHSQGMTHRDLKPANVMLTTKGDVVLTDFGIARIVGGTHYTATGAIIGTPAYMSPEQGQGQAGDERSDVYALGVILYELVTGRVPFDADTPLAVIFKHISDPLPLPRHLNSALPEGVEKVILKALAKNPGDRYQRASDMANALADALAGETATVERGAGATEVAAAGETAVLEPAIASSALVPGRPVPLAGVPGWAWAAGGLVLGGVLVLTAVLVLGRPGGPAAAELVLTATLAEASPPGPTAATAAQTVSTDLIVVDNAGPGFSVDAGDWGECSYDGCGGMCYGVDFRYADPGCTTCQAHFDVRVSAAGEYEVWTWWPQGDDRSTDTPFTVGAGGDSFVVKVDQRNQGNTWHRLGQVTLEAGGTVSIVVKGSDTGYANADAVALSPAGAEPPTTNMPGVAELPAKGIIVDDADSGFSIEGGDWEYCGDGDCGGTSHGGDSRYAYPGCTACQARFDVRVSAAGQYEVWAWWPQGGNRAMDTPFTIKAGSDSFTVIVDQRSNGNAWYRLGDVTLEAGGTVSVVVRGSNTGHANADAVALTPSRTGS